MSKIYYEAASILSIMDKTKRGLRDVFYDKKQFKQNNVGMNKQVFALVCNVIRDSSIISEILIQSGVLNTITNTNNITEPSLKAVSHNGLWSKRQLTRNRQSQKLMSLDKGESHVNIFLWRVMTWDLLFGKGLHSGGTVAKTLKLNKDNLNIIKDSVCINRKKLTSCNSEYETKQISRYLRVNTCRISTKEAFSKLTEFLKQEIFELENNTLPCLVLDSIIPNVIEITNTKYISNILQHPLLVEGSVVFQDRASCLSALMADIKPGMFVLDCCAAPGSKTLHSLDLLQGKGKIVAVEKDPKRACILIDRIKLSTNLLGPFKCLQCFSKIEQSTINEIKTNTDNVIKCKKQTYNKEILQEKKSMSEIHQAVIMPSHYPKRIYFTNQSKELVVEIIIDDFFTITPETFKQRPVCNNCEMIKTISVYEAFKTIDAILLDPSCSGSGLPLHDISIVSKTTCSVDAIRRNKLAFFQQKLLTHVLKEFSQAKTICYSTCSVKVQENEMVVHAALKDIQRNNSMSYTLVNIPSWESNNLSSETMEAYLASCEDKDIDAIKRLYDLCFHSHPNRDNCRGFFLAKIQHCNTENN